MSDPRPAPLLALRGIGKSFLGVRVLDVAPGEVHAVVGENGAVKSTLMEIVSGGYAVCIESFTAENETIATAAAIWRPLAVSQDRLAVDGLHQLREVIG